VQAIGDATPATDFASKSHYRNLAHLRRDSKAVRRGFYLPATSQRWSDSAAEKSGHTYASRVPKISPDKIGRRCPD
jgi:hypothetical protein